MKDVDTKKALITLLERINHNDESAALDAYSELCGAYGNLSRLFAADFDELSRNGYLGERGAVLIKLVAALAARRVTDGFAFGKKHTEAQLLDYLKARFIDLSNETVYCLYFDDEGRTLACEFIADGTVNYTDVFPRRMLEFAIKHKASCAIVAHNHPKGRAEASLDDVKTTMNIASVFRDSGRRLLAHYVIVGSEHFKIDVPG